jgi:hypothetical protein
MAPIAQKVRQKQNQLVFHSGLRLRRNIASVRSQHDPFRWERNSSQIQAKETIVPIQNCLHQLAFIINDDAITAHHFAHPKSS